MRRAFPSAHMAVLFLAILGAPASGQTFPTITERTFTSGSVTVTVTGSHTIREEVQINKEASIGGGDMNWLQYGVSGSDKIDVLITYADQREIGITVGRRKVIATAGIIRGGESQCTGKMDVTATMITGEFRCNNVTSHDPATGKLGTVDMTVSFTAKS